jgi:hypothetical protein
MNDDENVHYSVQKSPLLVVIPKQMNKSHLNFLRIFQSNPRKQEGKRHGPHKNDVSNNTSMPLERLYRAVT